MYTKSRRETNNYFPNTRRDVLQKALQAPTRGHQSLFSDSIATIFHLQKQSTEVGNKILMHCTQDANLNPMAHWDRTIFRIMAIQKWHLDWPVNTIHRNGKGELHQYA